MRCFVGCFVNFLSRKQSKWKECETKRFHSLQTDCQVPANLDFQSTLNLDSGHLVLEWLQEKVHLMITGDISLRQVFKCPVMTGDSFKISCDWCETSFTLTQLVIEANSIEQWAEWQVNRRDDYKSKLKQAWIWCFMITWFVESHLICLAEELDRAPAFDHFLVLDFRPNRWVPSTQIHACLGAASSRAKREPVIKNYILGSNQQIWYIFELLSSPARQSMNELLFFRSTETSFMSNGSGRVSLDRCFLAFGKRSLITEWQIDELNSDWNSSWAEVNCDQLGKHWMQSKTRR